jgi:hypothetical protein
MSTRRGSHQQSGQALVAVIVLIALLFLIGTAMTLAVSSSLQTVRQTASEDWRGYAAESAATRDLAGATTAPPSPGCQPMAGMGLPVNGFAVFARRCSVAQVDSTSIRQDAIAAQNLQNTCPAPGAPTPCTVIKSVGFLYFSCDKALDSDGDYDNSSGQPQYVHVQATGPVVAHLSTFYVRSANPGNDCAVTSAGVATSAGIAGGAVDEADLVVPNCNPPATAVTFWNKLLP